MERRYSFFQAPFLAFSSSDLYRDVANNWKGSGLLYMFLLSSAAWAVSALGVFAPMMQVVNNKDLATIYQQVPSIVIENGKMTLDRPCPYDIKDTKTGIPYMRIAADRAKEKMITGDPPIVFTQTSMLVSEESIRGSRNSYKLASYEDAAGNGEKGAEPAKVVLRFDKVNEVTPRFELTGKSLQSLIEKIVLSLPLAILVVGWPFVFIVHAVQLLIYGGITALAASMLQREMNFEKAMRLAAIAMTPGIIISALLSTTQFHAEPLRMINNCWVLASIPLALFYIVMVVRAVPEAEIAR